ncbi:MAG: BatD family protein [Sulfurimonas sp.]|uniref:BatD family protein n=1 Tax=Sulfurimonas sp. TaxID=2022749 RepID=UPI003D0CF0FA
MRTITKLLFLQLLFLNTANAEVVAAATPKEVELGEMVTYSLTISGEDITRPNIRRLCDSDVISTSSQTSMQITNGAISKNYMLSYKFVPQKSCVINPVEVEIDGKTESSNSVEIKVVPISGAKDLDFVLKLQSSKKELFVGEAFDLKLTFKQRSDAQAVESEFTPPELKGFWIKNESQPKRYQDSKYTITEIVYSIAPQRAGELKISQAQMRIASRGSRTSSWGDWIPTIKWKTYFSNELSFDVKPLPSGVSLVGDFAIKAIVDKSQIKANEAVNLTLQVEGEGNFEDIKSFKPQMEDVAVFDEKIVIEGKKLTQKIAFVADRDFTIPSFSLRYFDPQTKEVKEVSTKEIKIDVINEQIKEELVVKKEEAVAVHETHALPAKEYDMFTLVFIFIGGVAAGVLIMLYKPYLASAKKSKGGSIKEPKVLLAKLLAFKDDKEVAQIVEILEKNIYSADKIEVDKKVLKELLKKYKID